MPGSVACEAILLLNQSPPSSPEDTLSGIEEGSTWATRGSRSSAFATESGQLICQSSRDAIYKREAVLVAQLLKERLGAGCRCQPIDSRTIRPRDLRPPELCSFGIDRRGREPSGLPIVSDQVDPALKSAAADVDVEQLIRELGQMAGIGRASQEDRPLRQSGSVFVIKAETVFARLA